MIKGVLQCCYTNASREIGNITSSGWQTVSISPDLPPDAIAACAKIQNANSSIQNNMVDENGNVLNLLEICGEGSYIFFIRTQYGLLDRLGRANLFSHAFIFPCKDSTAVTDPNSILTVSNENFHYSEEAADEEKTELLRLQPFVLSETLQKCGLNEEMYLALIKCVYARLSDKRAMGPLFIQFDGTEDMLRGLLFCIYSALPFSLRKKLSVASARTDATDSMNLVFSQKATSYDLFINPANGANNILTPRLERRLLRLGFLDYAVHKSCNSEIGDYFAKLEAKAIELGDQTASNELILKIAHLQLTDNGLNNVHDAELDVRLSDALRSNSVGNSSMDEYIAALLSEMSARKMTLTEENDEALTERLDSTLSTALSNAVEQYNYCRVRNLPQNEAIVKLSKMPAKTFLKNRERLLSSEDGIQLLDLFYSMKLDEVGKTWNDINDVIDASRDLPSSSMTDAKIDDVAWDLYRKSFEGIIDGKINNVVNEYYNFVKLMQKLHGHAIAEKSAFSAKEAFWEKISYETIDCRAYSACKQLWIDSPKCKCMLAYCSLYSNMVIKKEEHLFFDEANAFFRLYWNEIEPYYETLADQLIKSTQIFASKNAKYYSQWCRLVFRAPQNNVLEILYVLFDRANSGDVDTLLKTFGVLFKRLEDGTQASKDIANKTASIIFLICKDSNNNLSRSLVSLDDWLLLGSCIFQNSFYIFDELKPSVLTMDAYDVVGDSHLLEQPIFLKEADKYVQRKQSEYKVVKKWLAFSKQLRQTSASHRKGAFEASKDGRKTSYASKVNSNQTVMPSVGYKSNNRTANKPDLSGRKAEEGQDKKKDLFQADNKSKLGRLDLRKIFSGGKNKE